MMVGMFTVGMSDRSNFFLSHGMATSPNFFLDYRAVIRLPAPGFGGKEDRGGTPGGGLAVG
jgi:hypothetical protein